MRLEGGETTSLSPGAQNRPQGASSRQAQSRPCVGSEPAPSALSCASGERPRFYRAPVKHSMLRRCAGRDYRQPGIYQITLTLADRNSQVLGEIKVKAPGGAFVSLAEARSLGLDPDAVQAEVELSPLGAAILELWKDFGDYTPEIKPLYCVVMPDHIHGILEVMRPMAKPLGNAVGGFKAGCTKIWRGLTGRRVAGAETTRLSPGAQNRADRAGSRQAQGGSQAAQGISLQVQGEALFSPGFQDTVLYHRGQLNNMFNYLRDNPRRRAVKALFPDFFKVVNELAIELHLSEPAEHRPGTTCPVPKAKAFGFFSALGNRFLLTLPLAQVQLSRSFFRYRRERIPGGGMRIVRDAAGVPAVELSTPEFEARRAELFDRAAHGEVLISPCVSDGEREIARLAFEAQLPLVALRNKGFSPLQKPSGRYFDACSEGRLLLLAPAAWPYVPGEKEMTRFDAVAMNRLAQLLAGTGAAEINYHGMQPANIDELAMRAVKKLQ